jgi:hypothetical protein
MAGRDALTAPEGAPLLLDAGIPAVDDAGTIEDAVASLLGQELPPGVQWGHLWIAVSPSHDGTFERVLALAKEDDRIRPWREPERRGKSAALNEIFERCQADHLVLLNADARAAPGAVRALFEASRGLSGAFAVMGRPRPLTEPGTLWSESLEVLWSLHHAVHAGSLSSGQGNHLSDEMLLLSRPALLPFPPGVINDGAYLGSRLRRSGGTLAYAAEAGVGVQVAPTLRQHLVQRRRIRVGHRQIRSLAGERPTTLPAFALEEPRRGLPLLRESLRGRDHPWAALTLLALAEGLAMGLALWDRMVPGRDHVRWQRIPSGSPSRVGRGSLGAGTPPKRTGAGREG